MRAATYTYAPFLRVVAPDAHVVCQNAPTGRIVRIDYTSQMTGDPEVAHFSVAMPRRTGTRCPSSMSRPFGLTSYPDERIFGLYVYPRVPRKAGTAAGHTRPADPPHADLWTATRARDRTRHPTNLGRRAARGAWCALSCAAAPGRTGWISAKWGVSSNNRKARFYSLTAAGRKQLVKETTKWKRLARAIVRILEPEAAER